MHVLADLKFTSLVDFWYKPKKKIGCEICRSEGWPFVEVPESNRRLWILGECIACHKQRKILREFALISDLEFMDFMIRSNQKFFAREACTLGVCSQQYMSSLNAIVAVEYQCAQHKFTVEYPIHHEKIPVLTPEIKPEPAPKRARKQLPKEPRPVYTKIFVQLWDYLAQAPTEFEFLDETYTKEALITAISEGKIAPESGCPFACGFVISPSTLNKHLLTHLKNSPTQCRWCGLSFRKINDLTLHLNGGHCIHRPPTWPFEKDKKGKPIAAPQTYGCRICQLHFSPADVAPHWFWYHPEHAQKCFFAGCSYNLTSPVRLLQHLASHYHNLPFIVLGDSEEDNEDTE